MMDTAAFVAETRRARRRMVTLPVERVTYSPPVRHAAIVEIAAVISFGRTYVTVRESSLTRVTKSLASTGERGRFVRATGAGHIIFESEAELVLKTIDDVSKDAAAG